MRRYVPILLVEDNPADVGLVEEAFREGKLLCDLHVVEDGVQALEFLRHQGAHGDSPTPDLVLLDLNLPKKDGREVLEDMKNDPALSQIPVIVLTTSDDEGDVLKAYGLHANCYLTKPVEIDDFLLKIRAMGEFWLTFARLPNQASAAL